MRMIAPVTNGVLTRRDDPATAIDERLHDQRSRDAGINGNAVNTPILSLFAGTVLTAADRNDGYGKAVRVEGTVTLSKARILTAHEPWPMTRLPQHSLSDHLSWVGLPDDWLLTLHVRALYAHANALYVKQGQIVSQFEPLMGMGNTGRSSGNHLHLKFRLLDLPEPICFVDPLPLFVWSEL